MSGSIFNDNVYRDNIRLLITNYTGELLEDPSPYLDHSAVITDVEVDLVGEWIADHLMESSDALLRIPSLERYRDLWELRYELDSLASLVSNPRIATALLARECLIISDLQPPLLSRATLKGLLQMGHFLLLRCWLDDFGSATWDDPGENPFVRIDDHWIRVLPRAAGGRCEICACGFDFADPDKSDLDPKYLQELTDRAADPVGFALKQVLAHQFEEFADYADLDSHMDTVPTGHLVHPNTVLEFSQAALHDLLKEHVDSVIPSFLERFSLETSKWEPDFDGSFSSIDEIEDSFEYAPSAYECLAAKTFLQLSSNENLDVSSRKVCSELGHSLLWRVDSLASSGFGYGAKVVEPEEHQPNHDAPGCKCGFPNIDFTD
jgi:hypothetical protein